MKKVTSLLLLVGVAAFGLVACGDNVVPPEEGNVEGVVVTPSTLNIAVGGSGVLSADVDGDPDNSVTWSSNNASVATVDGDGNVTGVAEGTAAVTATSTVDNSQSGSATVNVTAAEEAQVSIGAITNAAGGPINVSNVAGQINVEVNVEEGDRTIETVELLLDGEPVTTQTFASASQVEEGVELQGEVAEIVFNFRTDRLEGSTPGSVITPDNVELDGNPKIGQFLNGDHILSARLQLANGSTESAENSQTLTFNNTSVATVHHLSGGNTAVESSTGARYWGGDDITLGVTPLIFESDVDASSVTIGASAGDQTASGNGIIVLDNSTASSPPFTFDILLADNAGGVEDHPDVPDGLGDDGSDFTVTDIRDQDGVTVASAFTTMPLVDFFLDFDAPDQSGSVEFAGVTTTVPGGSVWYSGFEDTGTVPIVLPGVSDDGVGGVGRASGDAYDSPGEDFIVDIIDSGTPGSASTLFSDVMATWELDEQAPSTATGATDHWAHVTEIADAVGNAVTSAGGGITVTTPVGDFGIDFTAPETSAPLPADATGTSQTGFVFNADGSPVGVLSVDIADPMLANGETPSGLQDDVTTPTFEIQEPDETVLASGVATKAGGGTFTVDPSVVADGEHFAFVAFNDQAEPVNADSHPWYYIKDTTAPVWGTLNPAPTGSSGTGANAIVMNIGGDVSDANEIVSATITVFVDGNDANGAGFSGSCTDATVHELDPSAGEIDQNGIDLANGTNAIDFSESFEIARPPSPTNPVTYCFILTADDEALDNTGAAAPNTATVSSEADVTWN